MLIRVNQASGLFDMHMKLIVLLGVLTFSSACQKKAEGQTVALVNDEEITTSELNAELTAATAGNNANKKEVTNRVLQGLVDRRLLAEQARKEGLDRSPEFIARLRRANEELLIGMMANRQLDTSKVPTEAEIATYQARQPQMFNRREVWRLQQLQYDTPRNPAVEQQILNTKSLEDVAAVLTQARVPFRRTNNQLVTSQVPPQMYSQLAALAPGEPFIVPAGDRSVASVIVERQPAPLTGPAARTEAANLIRRENSTRLLEQRLKELRSAAKIEYKEGFGPAAAK